MNQPVESILEVLILKILRIIFLIGVLIFESTHIVALVSNCVPVQRVIIKRKCSHPTVICASQYCNFCMALFNKVTVCCSLTVQFWKNNSSHYPKVAFSFMFKDIDCVLREIRKIYNIFIAVVADRDVATMGSTGW